MIYEIICYNGSFPEDSRAKGFVYQSFQRWFVWRISVRVVGRRCSPHFRSRRFRSQIKSASENRKIINW